MHRLISEEYKATVLEYWNKYGVKHNNKGKSLYAVARKFGVNRKTLDRWATEERMKNVKLEKIRSADMFSDFANALASIKHGRH